MVFTINEEAWRQQWRHSCRRGWLCVINKKAEGEMLPATANSLTALNW